VDYATIITVRQASAFAGANQANNKGVMNENLAAHDRFPRWGSGPLSKPERNDGFPKRMINSRRISFKDM
jgi:hypothetical protein